MKSIFDKVSNDCSKLVIKRYSTSFYFSSSLLSKTIRQDIFNIYGFVRLADEIVDTFHEYPKKELLEDFEKELWRSVDNKISLNPILNSFQHTVNKYSIPKDLINSFLESMKMDLEKKEYNSVEEYRKYIYGSADVVGLMCLKVFVKGSESSFAELSPFAISLGSAFQKVNFLRDLKDDSNVLNRVYFPNVDMNNFNEKSKKEIILEIEKDFENAVKGIVKLPKNSKFAVYIAYRYYNKLLKKLKRTSSENIVKKRIRIHNFQKFIVIARSYVKYQLNLIQWI
jgi:phytoene/squalene synthetase